MNRSMSRIVTHEHCKRCWCFLCQCAAMLHPYCWTLADFAGICRLVLPQQCCSQPKQRRTWSDWHVRLQFCDGETWITLLACSPPLVRCGLCYWLLLWFHLSTCWPMTSLCLLVVFPSRWCLPKLILLLPLISQLDDGFDFDCRLGGLVGCVSLFDESCFAFSLAVSKPNGVKILPDSFDDRLDKLNPDPELEPTNFNPTRPTPTDPDKRLVCLFNNNVTW